MDEVSELREREVETYFDVVAGRESERLLRARSFHNLGEWERADYERLSDRLLDADATSSFSFLGRDAERYAETIESLDELGIGWVLGRTDDEIPPDIDFREPVHPYDLIILNEGAGPGETFERIAGQTRQGAALLFHPNMLEYYDAIEEFEAWIAETGPVSVGTLFDRGGVGLVNDAMRPLRVE